MTVPFRISITIILAVLSKQAFSQGNDTLKVKRVVVTTSAFDYLGNNQNNGNLNIGAEVYLKKRTSVYANVGAFKQYGPASGWFTITSEHSQGMKIQIEGRHYLNNRKMYEPTILLFWPHIFQYKTQSLQNTGYYYAIHSFYQYSETVRQETVVEYDNINPFPNNEHYIQNLYTVYRSSYGLNIKFGYQCIKKYGLTVDYAIGIGAQYISSYSVNRLGLDTDWPEQQREIFTNKLFDKGAGVYPSFIYEVLIGWGL